MHENSGKTKVNILFIIFIVINLQDAVELIGEIRKKLKVLEDFYVYSNPNNSAD